MFLSVIYLLIQDMAFLLAAVFLFDAVTNLHHQKLGITQKVFLGVLVGIVTIVVMLPPWEVTPSINYDARSVIIMISGVFFGALPTAIAVIMAIIYRISEGGDTVFIGSSLIILSGIIALLWRMKYRQKLTELTFINYYLIGFSSQVFLALLIYLVPKDFRDTVIQLIVLPTLILFPLTFALLAMFFMNRIKIQKKLSKGAHEDFIFRSQFTLGNVGLAISTLDKNWVKVNPKLCRMLNYTEEELTKLKWTQVTFHEDVDKDITQYNRMLAGEIEQYEMDKRFIAKDGSIVYTRQTISCQRVDGKVEFSIGSFLDNTKQKQIEKELRDSKQQFELVLNSSDLGLWDWDIKADVVHRNSRCSELLGCGELELANDYRLWINAIYQQDRMDVLHAMDVHLRGDTEQYKIEYRLKTRGGETLWIQDLGKVAERDSTGEPIRICGIHTDITERKRVEESLKLSASVYNNSSEAMSVQDDEGRIITINSAFTNITGYSEAEVINKQITLLQCDAGSKHQATNQYSLVEEALTKNGHWQGELWLKHKNGSDFIVWLTINSIKNERGEIYRRLSLFSDITEKKQAEQIIWKQANYDTLTGLPNRRMLLDHLSTELLKSERQQKHFAFMFLDLDYFKEVNDTLGHDLGDQLLIETAKRLKSCVRNSDIVARLGGDEFTLVLSSIDDYLGIERVAENILSRLSEPYSLGNETAYISASIGITMFPDDTNTIEGLLKNADQAMYAAKGKGRNRFQYFTPSMQEHAKHRMLLIRDLRDAVKKQQFEVYYQPIVELSTDSIIKAEALIRWNHPTRGIVSPAEFIPIAEDTGLIIEIGNWVFEQAAKQNHYWRNNLGVNIQISINKSPVQFSNEEMSFKHWIAYLNELNLPHNSICIEITEGLLLDASDAVSEKLLGYRDAGIQVSLDDFGTGYSSLAYLKKLDIDYLKIDQSFTRNLENDSNDVALCDAIIVMAHKLGLKVIAEGVETEFQKNLLSEAGCDFAQGYYFSKPLKVADFEQQCILPQKTNSLPHKE